MDVRCGRKGSQLFINAECLTEEQYMTLWELLVKLMTEEDETDPG